MNNLYDALEVCLEAIEQGTDIETTLARYPDMADELRPILQASMVAREKAVSVPSAEVLRRNRADLLQRAALLRASNVRPAARDIWFASLRRLAVTVLVLVAIFGSGAGLVSASSTTLPGDNLYPLKRTWEDVALLFTFNLQKHESLEVEYENERLKELHELIAEGRSARVDFCGIVMQQNGNEWMVSGITIIVSPQTDFHDGPVSVGDAVDVFGIVQGDDSVLVERIDLLPPGAPLPDIGNSGEGSNNGSGSGNDNNGNDVANENDSSGSGDGNDNSNDNGSGSSGSNDNENNTGPGGGNDNENSNNSGSGSGVNSGNDNNNGPGISGGSGHDNSNDDNSGSGSGNNNSNEDNSGSGSGSDDSNEDNSGPGSGDNGNEDNSGPGGGGSDDNGDNGNEDNSGPGGGGD